MTSSSAPQSHGSSGPWSRTAPHREGEGLCYNPLQVVVVSAMGSHESSPIKVTDLLLNMVAKAARQDEAFLLDLAELQVRPSSGRRTACRDLNPPWSAACVRPRQ